MAQAASPARDNYMQCTATCGAMLCLLCCAMLCSPVAVHDGHAEGQKGVPPAALDRVQHVKQRGALQAAAEQGQGASNLSGQLLQSGSKQAAALPDMANTIKLHIAAAGRQQGCRRGVTHAVPAALVCRHFVLHIHAHQPCSPSRQKHRGATSL
jgi:hypothetical protein